MRVLRPILLLLIICTYFSVESKAQNVSAYKDSVKEFFKEWKTLPREFKDSIIWDNPILMYGKIDSIMLMDDRKRFRFNMLGATAYKYKNNNFHLSPIDSIVFSKKEMAYIISKTQNPLLKSWDNEIFAQARIIKQSEIDSFFKTYNLIRSKAGDAYNSCGGDTLKMMNYSAYRQYKQMQKNILWYQGYWKFSNPVFVRNGTLALDFYWHYYGEEYISYYFNVYRKVGTHWDYFGNIAWGIIN